MRAAQVHNSMWRPPAMSNEVHCGRDNGGCVSWLAGPVSENGADFALRVAHVYILYWHVRAVIVAGMQTRFLRFCHFSGCF